MATHDVDRKILSRFARDARDVNAALSSALYQILGLSKMLSRRLLRARKLRKLDPYDEKSMTLYHHIIWMSREGLSVVESTIMPFAESRQFGTELRIFAYKLRASFYHVFCLFHNRPSVSPLNPADSFTVKGDVPTVLLPIPGNDRNRRVSPPEKFGEKEDQENPKQVTRGQGGLREPIISMLSDESNVTNPYGSLSGLSPPPGLPGRDHVQVPDPAAFLLPSANFIPLTIASFTNASALAEETLSGSSPLRLSIALEHSAFLWDCLHDHNGSRKLAGRTIKQVYSATEGMDDSEFDDAALLVGTLGRMMRRKSEEQTPKMAPGSPGNPAVTGKLRPENDAPPPIPKLPPLSEAEQQALRQEALRAQRQAQAEVESETKASTPERTPEDKPLPVPPPAQAAQQEGMYNIPRRPVGTPPRGKSPARPSTAGKSPLTSTSSPETAIQQPAAVTPQPTAGAAYSLLPQPIPEVNVITPTTAGTDNSLSSPVERRVAKRASSPPASSPSSSKVHRNGRNSTVKNSMIPRPRRGNGSGGSPQT